MIESPEAAKLVAGQGGKKPFSDAGLQAFAEALTKAHERGEKPNVPLLIAGLEKETAERITAILREDMICAEAEKGAQDCLNRIERCDISCRIETIKQQLTEPSTTADDRAEKLREMQQLNLRMRGL
jgi:hypothetical protein